MQNVLKSKCKYRLKIIFLNGLKIKSKKKKHKANLLLIILFC